MAFSKPLTGHQLYDREPPNEYKGFKGPGTSATDLDAIAGRGLEAVFDFGPLDSPLLVKVAISPVSEDNAVANLKAEAPGWDFDGARTAARAAWDKALGAVEIDAAEPMRKSLYTALYHALMAPSLDMDVDGRYRGPDNAVHKADGFTFVSTFSLWDTFRAEQPLMTLIRPEQRTADVVSSLVASQQESPFGILPVWQFAGQETWCMIGYHAVPEIADAIMKDIKGFDREAALKAMVASATYAPYGGLGDYMRLGWVAIDKEPEAASKTVEYAFDDWTIARAAHAIGRDDIAKTFAARAGTGATSMTPRPLSSGQGRAMAPSANRSTRPRSSTAATTPRATPGSGRSSPRRTRPAWSRAWAATRPSSPSWTPCSTSMTRNSTIPAPRISPA